MKQLQIICKAIEYYIKEKIKEHNFFEHKLLKNIGTLVHFGLTSQDINSSSYMLSMKDSIETVIEPQLDHIFNILLDKSENWLNIPMLSRTHGQPASPTFVGKELLVYVERLRNEYKLLDLVDFTTKFGGAVGNLNAHYFADNKRDWIKFADEFIEEIGLERNVYTTQDHYNNYSVIFDCLKRINTVFRFMSKWSYISHNYFKLKIKKKRVHQLCLIR